MENKRLIYLHWVSGTTVLEDIKKEDIEEMLEVSKFSSNENMYFTDYRNKIMNRFEKLGGVLIQCMLNLDTYEIKILREERNDIGMRKNKLNNGQLLYNRIA